MTINQRVFELLSEQGRRQAKLTRAMKISERNVSTWKERGTDPPAKYHMMSLAWYKKTHNSQQ